MHARALITETQEKILNAETCARLSSVEKQGWLQATVEQRGWLRATVEANVHVSCADTYSQRDTCSRETLTTRTTLPLSSSSSNPNPPEPFFLPFLPFPRLAPSSSPRSAGAYSCPSVSLVCTFTAACHADIADQTPFPPWLP